MKNNNFKMSSAYENKAYENNAYLSQNQNNQHNDPPPSYPSEAPAQYQGYKNMGVVGYNGKIKLILIFILSA